MKSMVSHESKTAIILYCYLRYALLALLFLVYIVRIVYDLSKPLQGDEYFYGVEISRYELQGIWGSFSQGISHLFVVLASILSHVSGSNLLGARLLNIILLPVSWLILDKVIRLINNDVRVSFVASMTFGFVLLISKAGEMFFYGVNDPLMIVLALVTILYAVKYSISYDWKHLFLTAVSAGMMLWVRQFSILIIAGILTWVAIISIKRRKFLNSILRLVLFVLVFSIVVLIVQMPSLADHGRVSFEKKNISGDWGARNWVMGVMRIPAGSIFAYKRPSWEQVDEYKLLHGKEKIPRGFIGRVIMDPKFMVDNFSSNLFVRFPFIILSSILLFIIPFFDFVRKPEYWLSTSNNDVLPLLMVLLSVCIGVSLVIVSYVEHRWQFMSVTSALVLASKQLESYPARKYVCAAINMQMLLLIALGLLYLILKVC